jgi:tRNA pseudouridine55 synthase
MTSFDVISKMKRILSQRKIGHAGTLDKAASGLLVVCAGKATRLSAYFLEKDKSYRGVFQLGIETDSCDGEGEVTSRKDPSFVTESMVNTAAEQFRGQIIQTPPVYSALKINGKRASDLAREGREVEMKQRQVTIYRFDIVDFNKAEMTITVDVDCSKGTYIRSIARDFGEKLGCGAYLKGLVRRSCGSFSLDEAMTPDELAACLNGEPTAKAFRLKALDALSEMGHIVVNDEGAAKIWNGAQFSRESVLSLDAGPDAVYAVYAVADSDKNLIAIAEVDIDNWQIKYRNVFHPDTVS